MGGETHQYYPELIYDNHSVKPEKTPAEGYHFSEDLTDKAISFIADAKQIAPNKPFFMYFCPGAMHARYVYSPGAPVTPDYKPLFKFTGKIHNVIVDVSGDLIHDSEAQMRMIMARQ